MAPISLTLICLLSFTWFHHSQGYDYELQAVTDYHDTFSTPKKNGPMCRAERHYCDFTAACSQGKCNCAEGEHGLGIFACLKNNWIDCRITGDPHMKSWSNSKAGFNVPCRQKLTNYNIGSSFSYDSSCEVTLFGTNIYRYGRFYADAVDGVLVERRRDYPDGTITFRADRNGVQLHLWTGDDVNIPWGTDYTLKIRDVQLAVSFDPVQRYVLVSAPKCFLRVKVRPVDLSQRRQIDVPGYSVATKKYHTFPYCRVPDGHYPNSFCGTPADGTDLFQSRVAINNARNVETALLMDWLAYTDANQENVELGAQCSAAVQAYRSCPGDKTQAVNRCAQILNSNELNECFYDNGISDPMTIFNNCMIGQCEGNLEACALSVSAMSACSAFGPAWVHDQGCSEPY